MTLDGFSDSTFTHGGATRTVYRRGAGPGVVIMHEIPGIHPDVARFATRVAEEGFTAVMPELFGETGRPVTPGYIAGQMLRACISREFHVLATRQSSPITDWLRALGRSVHAECGGRGVGAIGMCLTGNFALALMVDESVMAPVLSQPDEARRSPLARYAGNGERAARLLGDSLSARYAGNGASAAKLRGDSLAPRRRVRHTSAAPRMETAWLARIGW